MSTTKERFVGSWQLKAWTAETEEGAVAYPFGADAVGRITYNNEGHMAVQIMRNHRSAFISPDPLRGQPEEIIDAYNGFLAYCGRYEVNLQSGQVVHLIEISSFPNWVGQQQIRNFDFRDNELVLSTDYIVGRRHRLEWIRE